jgi:hypothetical protein
MKKDVTPSEQFLFQIGNIVEAEAISIPLTDKYMSSHLDHFNQYTVVELRCGTVPLIDHYYCFANRRCPQKQNKDHSELRFSTYS